MEKEIIIIGTIGNTARQNRDNARVLGGGGTMYTLKSHIHKERPLVLRKWKRKSELLQASVSAENVDEL